MNSLKKTEIRSLTVAWWDVRCARCDRCIWHVRCDWKGWCWWIWRCQFIWHWHWSRHPHWHLRRRWLASNHRFWVQIHIKIFNWISANCNGKIKHYIVTAAGINRTSYLLGFKKKKLLYNISNVVRMANVTTWNLLTRIRYLTWTTLLVEKSVGGMDGTLKSTLNFLFCKTSQPAVSSLVITWSITFVLYSCLPSCDPLPWKVIAWNKLEEISVNDPNVDNNLSLE